MSKILKTHAILFTVYSLLSASLSLGFAEDKPVASLMGIGLALPSPWTPTAQFVDMMKYSREWSPEKDKNAWAVIEDKHGWPISLKDKKNGAEIAIDKDHPIFMYMYSRGISGDIVLTWEGNGEIDIAPISFRPQLIKDEFPKKKRRVYRFEKIPGIEVYKLRVLRSNPKNHVRNIRLWMPGFEGSRETFHPAFKKMLEPFSYFRFMEWGRANNSIEKEWSDRTKRDDMRQSVRRVGVAYEYMIQLCNEMNKDAWICIPHMASDDYIRQLAKLLKKKLKPDLKVYVEYSNEIWNPSFRQTGWLWEQARKEIKTKGLKDSSGRPLKRWEYASTLCGKRSAEIWKIMSKELKPDRIVRVIAHFRYLDKAMNAALDKKFGDGRVDLIALNGYFISQDSLDYVSRKLDNWDIDEAMEILEQQHLLGKAMEWKKEIGETKKKWPEIPITCYEGGQHLANPFLKSKQGKKLTEKMIEVNADKRIRKIYATALETWRLAGGSGFTPFNDCGTWSKYGCWGHKEYLTQPLDDIIDPESGKIKERGAHKYASLLDYIERWKRQDAAKAPKITSNSLPKAAVGQPYSAKLTATGGTPPYAWSLFGGRLPEGLKVNAKGEIAGTPAQAEQLACVIECRDSKGRRASKIMGVFIDPATETEMEKFDFTRGIPSNWKKLEGKGEEVVYLPESEPLDGQQPNYTAEVVFSPPQRQYKGWKLGLAFCLSPEGDRNDFLRIAIDATGHQLLICSRYVPKSRGEVWGPKMYDLIHDKGETEGNTALDQGENWIIKATVRPSASPGAIDILVGVFDQEGKPRIDGTDRSDVANGYLLIRELMPKDALRKGPFGFLSQHMNVKEVKWKKND